MKLFVFLILVLLLTFISCAQKSSNFTIVGSVKGGAPDFLYLEYGGVIDSTQVEKGRFIFTGYVDDAVTSELSIHPFSTVNEPLYIEKGITKLDLKIEKRKHNGLSVNFIEIQDVSGGDTYKIKSDFEHFKMQNETLPRWKENLYDKLKVILKNNSRNPFAADVLYEVSRDTIFKKSEINALYQLLNSKNTSHWSMSQLESFIDPEKVISEGNQIITFSLPDVKNNIINTNKYETSVYLIDFWASWCKPCRAKHPKMRGIYTKYKRNGFKILSVSLDSDRKKWLKAISEDKLVWDNVIDLKGFNGDVALKYSIMAIPKNVLVDKYGIVIKRDINLDSLNNYLSKSYNPK